MVNKELKIIIMPITTCASWRSIVLMLRCLFVVFATVSGCFFFCPDVYLSTRYLLNLYEIPSPNFQGMVK